MNGNNAITFSDDTELDKVESTEYLGGIMHVGINNKVEISSRIAATMPIMFALNHFWKQTKCSTRWKIEIFNSVIVSKLLYGLETLQYHINSFTRINTFQMKGLRKILDIPPTFIDRSNTDDIVIQKCNDILKAEKSKNDYQTPYRNTKATETHFAWAHHQS